MALTPQSMSSGFDALGFTGTSTSEARSVKQPPQTTLLHRGGGSLRSACVGNDPFVPARTDRISKGTQLGCDLTSFRADHGRLFQFSNDLVERIHRCAGSERRFAQAQS